MGIVAAHVRIIRPSDTKAATARAQALREGGSSVITLSQGEADFDTPVHVREAARSRRDTHTRPIPRHEVRFLR